jgi:hypothetical protein
MKILSMFAVVLVLAAATIGQVGAQETRLTWFGHAAFAMVTPKGKVLLIDPWLGNPLNPDAKSALKIPFYEMKPGETIIYRGRRRVSQPKSL